MKDLQIVFTLFSHHGITVMHGETCVANKISKNLYKLIMLIVFATMVLCCNFANAQPNYRTYIKSGITAGGSLLKSGEVKYYSIRVGVPGNPLNKQLVFSIHLHGGLVLQSTEFNYTIISAFATQVKTQTSKDWGGEIEEFTTNGLSFVFLKDQCVSFSANYVQLPDKTYAPEIGSEDKKIFYKMPLSEIQLEDIFGKPERLVDKTIL